MFVKRFKYPKLLLLSLLLLSLLLGSKPLSALAGSKGIAEWEAKTSMPYSTVNYPSATGSNGKIYVFGAIDSSGSVQEYDPSTNQWNIPTTIPTPRTLSAAASDKKGRIYLVGGVSETCFCVLSTLEVYDTVNNTWTSLADMPTSRLGLGLVLSNNGEFLYAIGGKDTTDTSVDIVEVYDIKSNTWSSQASMPYPNAYFGIANAANGRIYVFGGETNPFGVLEYSPNQDEWQTVGSMPVPRAILSAVSAENGKIYVAGGWNFNDQPTELVDEYDPIHNVWHAQPVLTIPRVSTTLASSGEYLYVIGGLGQTPNGEISEQSSMEGALLLHQPSETP